MVELLQNNIPMTRIEYLDDQSIRASNKYSKGNLLEKPSIFIEISGLETSIQSLVSTVKEIMLANGGFNFNHSSKMEERSKLWKARHDLYYACRTYDPRPGTRAMITDVCVPISKLPEIILKMRQYLDEYKLNGKLCRY